LEEYTHVEKIKDDEEMNDNNYKLDNHSTFDEMNLRPELLKAISDNAFENPSEVQRECIPQGIYGMDILCQAKSGTGKTAVFVLVILERMKNPQPFNAIILANTRELSFQIKKEFDRFSKGLNITTECIYGGVPFRVTKDALQKNQPNIIVGTPGRVLMCLKEKVFNLDKIE